jgi:hypothetical protein
MAALAAIYLCPKKTLSRHKKKKIRPSRKFFWSTSPRNKYALAQLHRKEEIRDQGKGAHVNVE